MTRKHSEKEILKSYIVCNEHKTGDHIVGVVDMGDVFVGQKSPEGKADGFFAAGSVYVNGEGFSRTCVGTYRNGEVFRGEGMGARLIGHYENGRVYRGRKGKDLCIGKYGEAAGLAAALLLLFPETEAPFLVRECKAFEKRAGSERNREDPGKADDQIPGVQSEQTGNNEKVEESAPHSKRGLKTWIRNLLVIAGVVIAVVLLWQRIR